MTNSLTDTLNYRGIWWLPENPEREVSGDLSYEPNIGVNLDLMGSFLDENAVFDAFGKTPKNIDVINGTTVDGKHCTLIDSFGTSSFNSNFPGYVRQTYKSKILILGYHFESIQELSFSSYEVSFEYLEEWIGKNPFKANFVTGNDKIKSYDVSYEEEFDSNFNIESLNAELNIIEFMGLKFDQLRHHEMSYELFVRLTPKKKQSINWYMSNFMDIQRLMTLLLGESTYPRKVSAFILDTDNPKDKVRLQIYYVPSANIPKRKLQHHQILLPYIKIKDQLPSIFNAWFDSAKQLRSVYDLYFGLLFRQELYVETRFLSMMQVLEGYLRAKFQGTYLPQKDYDRFKNLIIEAFPDDMSDELKSSLKGKLKYGNEHSLRKRLKILFKQLDPNLKRMITKDSANFITQIVENRNNFTHLETGRQKPNTEKLFRMQHHLRVLIAVLLLQELNIDNETILEALTDNNKLKQWLSDDI